MKNSVKPVKAASSDFEIKQLGSNSVGQTGHIDEAALYRRIDWRIVPLMFLCYLLVDLLRFFFSLSNINLQLAILGQGRHQLCQHSWTPKRLRDEGTR